MARRTATGTGTGGVPGVDRPLRVTHCPVNTAGVPWQNVQALRRRGVEARLVVFERGKLHPEADWSLDRPASGLLRRQEQPASRDIPQERHRSVVALRAC